MTHQMTSSSAYLACSSPPGWGHLHLCSASSISILERLASLSEWQRWAPSYRPSILATSHQDPLAPRSPTHTRLRSHFGHCSWVPFPMPPPLSCRSPCFWVRTTHRMVRLLASDRYGCWEE